MTLSSLCFSVVEVNAVGDSDEHIAVSDPVVLGHAHTDAVASGVDHGLEVAGRVDPVVDGTLEVFNREMNAWRRTPPWLFTCLFFV